MMENQVQETEKKQRWTIKKYKNYLKEYGLWQEAGSINVIKEKTYEDGKKILERVVKLAKLEKKHKITTKMLEFCCSI